MSLQYQYCFWLARKRHSFGHWVSIFQINLKTSIFINIYIIFLGASCFVVSLHAIFYNIDAIVTEEAEGFLAEVV